MRLRMSSGMSASGRWNEQRGDNLLDGGAPFYDTYETADGKYVAVGSIEPQFYALLLDRAGLDAAQFSPQNDPAQWPAMRERLAAGRGGAGRPAPRRVAACDHASPSPSPLPSPSSSVKTKTFGAQETMTLFPSTQIPSALLMSVPW